MVWVRLRAKENGIEAAKNEWKRLDERKNRSDDNMIKGAIIWRHVEDKTPPPPHYFHKPKPSPKFISPNNTHSLILSSTNRKWRASPAQC